MSTSPQEVDPVVKGIHELCITDQEENVGTRTGAVGGIFPPETVASASQTAIPEVGSNFQVKADIEALKDTTSDLQANMKEILALLRSSKAEEAMSAIDSIKMPIPSVASARYHQGSYFELRELSHTALKVPVFVGASDLALRGIWKDIELWDLEVTSSRYRNFHSTFEAVRQFLSANVPKTSHPSKKIEVFRQTIQEFITKEYH